MNGMFLHTLPDEILLRDESHEEPDLISNHNTIHNYRPLADCLNVSIFHNESKHLGIDGFPSGSHIEDIVEDIFLNSPQIKDSNVPNTLDLRYKETEFDTLIIFIIMRL